MPVHIYVAECAWNRGYICHWGASFLEDVSLVELMYPVLTSVPGGVTVGDSGLCCCVPCLLNAINSLCFLIPLWLTGHQLTNQLTLQHSENWPVARRQIAWLPPLPLGLTSEVKNTTWVRTHGRSSCTASERFTVVFRNNTATSVLCLHYSVVLGQPAGPSKEAHLYASADWLSSSASQSLARGPLLMSLATHWSSICNGSSCTGYAALKYSVHVPGHYGVFQWHVPLMEIMYSVFTRMPGGATP